MDHNSNHPIARRPLGSRAIAAIALVGAAASCAASSSVAPRTAREGAELVARTRCVGVRSDANVDAVLRGDAGQTVQPLYGMADPERSGVQSELRGATVTVSPLPGMSTVWLERALECHSAAATLRKAPTTTPDPFYLPDALVEIRVRPVGDSFEVEVTAPSPDDARQILSRARAWANGKTDAVSLSD